MKNDGGSKRVDAIVAHQCQVDTWDNIFQSRWNALGSWLLSRNAHNPSEKASDCFNGELLDACNSLVQSNNVLYTLAKCQELWQTIQDSQLGRGAQ
jgi:hypothetical protein